LLTVVSATDSKGFTTLRTKGAKAKMFVERSYTIYAEPPHDDKAGVVNEGEVLLLPGHIEASTNKLLKKISEISYATKPKRGQLCRFCSMQ
jgi:hypothetical protein